MAHSRQIKRHFAWKNFEFGKRILFLNMFYRNLNMFLITYMPILQSNIHNLFFTWVVQKLRRQEKVAGLQSLPL